MMVRGAPLPLTEKENLKQLNKTILKIDQNHSKEPSAEV